MFVKKAMEGKPVPKRLGRNAPWCGSGKKYKQYHLMQDMPTRQPQSSFNVDVNGNR